MHMGGCLTNKGVRGVEQHSECPLVVESDEPGTVVRARTDFFSVQRARAVVLRRISRIVALVEEDVANHQCRGDPEADGGQCFRVMPRTHRGSLTA
jgi:hypothetical protein